ncbi:hypothetical protein H6F32_19920 [Anabaena sp. FACHB-1237]|uniref:hypothetical protein n=1 Tax=Anabaena sp. FACHB-1237 TaxID=2692769 RepID=UPI0016816D5F|nr:hypothetical protein [Anabaena sp. FACHB-1237]MBD2139759.1 hypothetical protein [Anabaena sp. FACHB-1237]
MLNSLISKLKKVKDFPKSQGRRHELWIVLTMIILALLTGNFSYKLINNHGRINILESLLISIIDSVELK